ncbi:LysR family transcriptional regulator [Dyella tabacisoli]|uniref:LysR family transcriptional regulator n=2 Tax=Dyella tabacisoli TaxID=2282381 RepID=A0A369UGF6_9GAMM|nr:LysR family transcriptional regulator [Dyella tabacisoli]
MSLDRLHAFLAVAEAGSFTAAAKKLGMGKNQLCLQVARLEKELATALFIRTTRRVVPTEAGINLQLACTSPLQNLYTAIGEFVDGTTRLSGVLRVTVPSDYAMSVIGPAFAAFSLLHPQLHLELITESRVLDLVSERIDLAVRLGWPEDSSMKSLKIGEFALFVAAAPAYLAQAGTPEHPSQLANHRWVALTLLRTPLWWQFKGPDGAHCDVRMRSGLSTNTPEGLLGLLRGGAGLSVVTDFSVAHDLQCGALRCVLPDWQLPTCGIYLIWPNTRNEQPKVRALIDFLRSWFLGNAGELS